MVGIKMMTYATLLKYPQYPSIVARASRHSRSASPEDEAEARGALEARDVLLRSTTTPHGEIHGGARKERGAKAAQREFASRVVPADDISRA